MAKIYRDKDGNDIPAKYVSQTDKRKHALAEKLHKKAETVSNKLEQLKDDTTKALDELYHDMLNDNSLEFKGSKKGGFSVSTLDKKLKVEIVIKETIGFDERIEMAKAKLDQYLDEQTKDMGSEIRQLITHAFETSRGSLDTSRVMSLLKLNIKHHLWTEAVDLIRESIQTQNTKRYVRFLKLDSQGEYQQVPLNIANY